MVYFFDLEKVDLRSYRAVIFGNVFYLDRAPSFSPFVASNVGAGLRCLT